MKSNIMLNKFPILSTNRLLLKDITHNNIDDIFTIFSNEQVTQFYDCNTFVSKTEAVAAIKMFRKRFIHKTGLRWGICLKEDSNKQIIGTCGYNSFVPRHRAIIGYDLLPQFWNKGLMTEALKITVQFGFAQLEVNRIEAHVMLNNVASIKVLKKLGFVQEGILREYGFWKNTYHDVYLFSLLRKDYMASLSQINKQQN
jgi:ribosomal-protein-alanine N-acetyltransferase